MEYLAIPSLLISVVSLILAIWSFRRTRIFQEHEYAPRLQVTNEQATFGSATLPKRPAFSYSAEIENRGLKPVEISSIHLDYGAYHDAQKRMKRSVEGEMYLSAGQNHAIDVTVSWSEVAEMKERLNINQAMFFLRLSYHRPNGKIEESIRGIGGFDGNSNVMMVPPGDRLT